MYKLTGSYWIKNEAPYLPEYLEFHLLQGFDHFIFYDNKSDDNTVEILIPYIKQGLVELRQYPPHIITRNNFWMMEHLITEQVGVTEWIHFHALDERIYCPDGRAIPELLKDYRQYGALCVAWEVYNSNGHHTKTPGLITERFTECFQDTPCHIKTIIRPDCAITHEGDPHNFRMKPGYQSVDERFNNVSGPWNVANYSYNKIKNHHYQTMSREEFDSKMNKGLLDHVGQENIRRLGAEEQWNSCHSNQQFSQNTFLLKYSEPVKEALRNRYKPYPELYKIVQAWYNL